MKDTHAPDAVPGSDRPAEAPAESPGSWRRVASAEPAPSPPASAEEALVEQRRDPRVPSALRVTTATIDPVADPVTGERVFQTSEEDRLLNVSRRGICVRATRPPEVGTRVLVQLFVGGGEPPIEVVGRTCWTRLEFEPGISGARPSCRVGIEVMGGSPRALERWDSSVRELEGSG